MQNANKMQTRTTTAIFLIVLLRAVGRIEARLTKTAYDAVIASYKEQIEDLRTFFKL